MTRIGQSERFAALDSLRGVAALLVLTFHCWKIGLFGELAGWQWKLLTWTPLNVLVSGRPWVILFFVLSGFVLACSLERAARIEYRGFVVRRLCRVYLPFVASIGLSLLLYALVQPDPIPELGRWFNTVGWDRAPTVPMVLEHLLMTGLAGEDSLNPVMWSLVYELRISLIFPLLFLATYRWPVPALVASLVLFVGAAALVGCRDMQCEPFRGADAFQSMLLTGYFSLFFVFGILLARARDAVRQGLRRWSGALLLGFGVAAVYATIIPSIPSFARFVPADIFFGLGATAMIALAIGDRHWEAVLHRPLLAWLGKVSYSLYLTHNIVLLAVVHLLYGRLGTMGLLTVVVLASLGVAWLGWWLVEAPAHRLGQRLGRRMAARPMLIGQA